MPDQEKTWQRNLRQAQNAASKNDPPQNDPSEEEEESPMMPQLPEPGLPKGPKETEEMKEETSEKIRKLTATALRSSFLQLIGTLGLALWVWPYIALHYIMSYMGGPLASLFPRPGREWIKPIVDKAPIPKKLKKWFEETIGQIIEILELMFTSCCCGSCLAIFLGILFFVWIFTSPCDTLQFFAKWAYNIATFFGFCKAE